MGKGVEKKKKKKGRPSLLDIQKRNLKLQQEEQQNLQTNPNSKTTSISPHRRFTRRNPNPDGIPDEDDDDEQEGNPRQRKLNHVLRAPPNQRSSVNSPYLDLGLYGSDSNEEGDYVGETPLKKQKINAVGSDKKGEKHKSVWKATEKQPLGHGTSLVSGPTTPLPDKQLLFFILDRLQKKDTYGVYSEPVDPNELPDYHEIIENPMDFGTVRKKVENGAYTSLEEFEHDVFLISSNAMQYNAPDSIYFRQARTIHELAKKNFENLRRDSDTEQEPKIVRRGRPPKNLKKLLGKSSSDHDGLDATPIKGEDNAAWSNSYNLRKGRLPDKYASVETSKRATHGPRNSEAYSWLPEYKLDKNDEFSGSSLKGMKYGKKQFVLDESRRNTYNNSHPSVGSELSVLNTFDGEVKQLLPVGLHSELGYARSLARFAANLGPVAWKVASKKIERALPPGMKFGPGWVGDDEAPPIRTSSLTIASPCPLPQQQPTASNQLLSSAAGPCMVEPNGERLLRHEFINKSSVDDFPDKIIPSTITPYSTVISRSLEAIGEPVEAVTRTSDSGLGLLSNSSGGVRPSIQIHQSPLIDPDLNGCSNGFGANPSSQAGPGWSVGNIGTDASVHSRIFDMVSKSNFINSTHGKTCELQNPRQPSAGNSVMGLQDCHNDKGFEDQTKRQQQTDLNVVIMNGDSSNKLPIFKSSCSANRSSIFEINLPGCTSNHYVFNGFKTNAPRNFDGDFFVTEVSLDDFQEMANFHSRCWPPGWGWGSLFQFNWVHCILFKISAKFFRRERPTENMKPTIGISPDLDHPISCPSPAMPYLDRTGKLSIPSPVPVISRSPPRAVRAAPPRRGIPLPRPAPGKIGSPALPMIPAPSRVNEQAKNLTSPTAMLFSPLIPRPEAQLISIFLIFFGGESESDDIESSPTTSLFLPLDSRPASAFTLLDRLRW